jgi:hypothetical protein
MLFPGATGTTAVALVMDSNAGLLVGSSSLEGGRLPPSGMRARW